jgi:hypothetical protein
MARKGSHHELRLSPVSLTTKEHYMAVKMAISCMIGALLSASLAVADNRISAEQVRQVMAATDMAAEHGDVQAIGAYLGQAFFKYVDVQAGEKSATARINRGQYLQMLEEGWSKVHNYAYQRKDVVVNVTADGSTAESFSTVVETFAVDGKEMVSKVREYARYELENGRPVIVNIDSQTLAGDTTP